MKKLNIFLFISLFLGLNSVSAAHFIVGYVNDSLDGRTANGISITLWNPLNASDNLTDIIGSEGNSGADNFYMFDCELFYSPCNIGDILSVKVFANQEGYKTSIMNVTVTDAGFDLVNELVLNSPTKLDYFYFDDDIDSPSGEIDLIAGGNRLVNCVAEFYDAEDESVIFIESRLFNGQSTYSAEDDNNNHYSNNSCISIVDINANTTLINCSYGLAYYSNSDDWNCTIKVNYTDKTPSYHSNISRVNKLLSFLVPDEINYGTLGSNKVSSEITLNISNYGNSALNLSLYGYAITPGDNLSMNCSSGENISIDYQKYNITSSNPGNMNINQFEEVYKNLTSTLVNNKFSLSARQNENYNEAINSTYWRIYTPAGASGYCSGKIVFGATEADGI